MKLIPSSLNMTKQNACLQSNLKLRRESNLWPDNTILLLSKKMLFLNSLLLSLIRQLLYRSNVWLCRSEKMLRMSRVLFYKSSEQRYELICLIPEQRHAASTYILLWAESLSHCLSSWLPGDEGRQKATDICDLGFWRLRSIWVPADYFLTCALIDCLH